MYKLRLIHNSAIFILIWNGLPALATVYDSDGSSTTVQYIHDTLAQNGDTIQLPAGTFIWNTQVHIVKNITLQGAGQGNTVINDNIPKDGLNHSILIWATGITGNFRITGFTIHGQAQDTNNWNIGTVSIGETSHSVRIDHITFSQPGTGAIITRGDIWGVIDHCAFDCSNFKQAVQVFNDSWGGGTHGDLSFEQPVNLGSGEGLYIEDSSFIGNGVGGAGAVDSLKGGRFVFRHNTITNNNISVHGTEYLRDRGMRSCEIYSNNFSCTIALMARAVHLRSGTGVIWGNTFAGNDANHTGYQNGIAALEYRIFNNWPMWGGPCNGSSPWDQNSDPTGYAAIDQVGRGMCLDQIRGETPINQRTGNAAWPRNQSEPVYVWSNTWHQVPGNPGSLITGDAVIQVGRDIINNGTTPMPGYVPFIYPHPLVTDPPMPSPTPSATVTPSPTATLTPTPSPTSQPSPTPTPSPAPSPTPTSTPAPTPTPSPAPSPTPTSTPAPTPTPTPTPQPSSTPRATPTATATPRPTATPRHTPRPHPSHGPVKG